VHTVPNPELIPSLGAGEQEAIRLAQLLTADMLLIDERKGRSEAVVRGLVVAGTLNILETAARRGLIELAPTIDELMKTNFRASPKLIKDMLARHQKTNDE
jgi:predicted nucleic acid-binding protein